MSRAWEGLQEESEGWREEREGWEREEEALEGLQEESESTAQFCSSCNQKKPLIDFGRFLTCEPCRQRNKRAKE